MKNAAFPVRLGFAWSGIRAVWRRERSFRTQAIIAAIAALATAFLRPGLIWCAAVALSIALVLALELLNSALEAVIDHLHPGVDPAIKTAKDAAAGAVLIASIAAVCVGACMVLSVVWR